MYKKNLFKSYYKDLSKKIEICFEIILVLLAMLASKTFCLFVFETITTSIPNIYIFEMKI